MSDSTLAALEPQREPAHEAPWPLDEAAKLSREILEAQDGVPELSCWGRIYNDYRKAKGPLIDALCPETGRRVVAAKHPEPTPPECREKWLVSMRIAARMASSGDLFTLVDRFQVEADYFALRIGNADVSRVAAESRLLALKGVKRGQRLTRAVGAHLRSLGATADEASRLVDLYASCAQVKPRSGWLVLSANPLDILFCSECCSYGSCHSVDGCHRAGPQCYLADGCTLVAYYYEETARFHGHKMPRKLWRQMVYVDRERKSAALQRWYGQVIPDDLNKVVRREVARLLTILDSGKCEGEPRWVKVEGKEGLVNNRKTLAYLDSTRHVVQLRGGEKYRPQIALITAKCGCCYARLDSAGLLVCEGCGDNRPLCRGCEERVSEDDEYSDPDSGAAYCHSCWREHWFHCHRCGEPFANDDRVTCESGNADYCQDCYLECYFHCDSCDAEASYGDRVSTEGGTYCSDCASACEDCGENFPNDELEGCRCGGCRKDREELAPLWNRLVESPRFCRANDGERAVAVALWWMKVGGGQAFFGYEYFRELIS